MNLHIRHWLPVVIWMAVIFTFSAIPNLKSGLDSTWDLVLRKCAHVLEYMILGWLTSRSLAADGWPRSRSVMVAMLICLLYAASDEFHQSFVTGRHAAWFDWLVDSFGSTLGIGLFSRKK